ncbi:MAG TPA: TlpA disulfide reductase family protein [Flavobacterium sp.]|uniref:TlpA family protein disulfide reductase n=1 Tax=Flavobacterium sp. TaxID=239 RepID=UPI002B4B2A0A|nr:TlpA disulfide reductase family protein [Flavobacterium sp.]HLO73100.1 TlpA disulfide reductase family protein [Flavobacterium sp.]
MIKKIFVLATLLISTLGCAQKEETSFKKEALNNVMVTVENKSITFDEILKKYEGKTIVVDIWASWCSDCIKSMPKVKDLQKKYPDATYLFISMDKTYDAWIKGIEKYEVNGEHYLTSDGMKGIFGKSVNLDWIPRYMVVDKSGKIVLYKVIEADDEKLIQTLDSLK